MVNVEKHMDFFNPVDINDPIHIIGVGAIGSHVAEQLIRLGVDELHIYDIDNVEAKNIANQMYCEDDIGIAKVEACAYNLEHIDCGIKIKTHPKGWTESTILSGHVFLCVDNIDLRRQIVENNMYNTQIKSMYDFRMRLSDAQHYAAAWNDARAKKAFLASMQFSHDEAKEATPVSACGTTLSVLPTVRMITAAGVSNFINYIKGLPLKKMILVDAFDFEICAV